MFSFFEQAAEAIGSATESATRAVVDTTEVATRAVIDSTESATRTVVDSIQMVTESATDFLQSHPLQPAPRVDAETKENLRKADVDVDDLEVKDDLEETIKQLENGGDLSPDDVISKLVSTLSYILNSHHA